MQIQELCVAACAGDGESQRRLVHPHFAAQSSFPSGIKALTARRFGNSTAHLMGG
jgi:hypothetical protein